MSVLSNTITISGGWRRRLAVLCIASALASIAYSPRANAVDLAFDGSSSLVAGTDCEVGARYRFGTSTVFNDKALDLIVEITGDDNDYSSDDLAGKKCLGLLIDDPGDPELFTIIGSDGGDNGATDEPWSNDLKFTIVEKGTDTVVTVDRIVLTAFDLDIQPGKTGTDNILLTERGITYLDAATEVQQSRTTINGPAGTSYSKLLLGTNTRDCSPETDTSCRAALVFTDLAEFSLRVFNNKSDPAAPRLFQFSFEARYLDDMNLGTDHGDAPVSYGDAGAGVSRSPLLGGGLPPDSEASTQPTDNASGDDTDSSDISDFDDDEGVTLNGVDFSGQTLYLSVPQTLEVSTYGGGRLNAFFDWNRDGDFDDAGEQPIEELALTTGPHAIQITPPATAVTGESFARFRFCGTANSCNVPSGYADDGETEDYRFILADSDGRSGATAPVNGDIKTGLDGSGIGGFGWWALSGLAVAGLRRKSRATSKP